MRCSAWSSLAISACSALLLTATAGAHIAATPAFLAADSTGVVSLSVHNDRTVPMDGFALKAPLALRLVEAGNLAGWNGSTDGMTATWTGGSLSPGDAETFSVVIEAGPEPGAASMRADQRYPDDRDVSWPVALTVVPGDESSGADTWVFVVVAVGLLLALAGVALAWRRRERSQ